MLSKAVLLNHKFRFKKETLHLILALYLGRFRLMWNGRAFESRSRREKFEIFWLEIWPHEKYAYSKTQQCCWAILLENVTSQFSTKKLKTFFNDWQSTLAMKCLFSLFWGDKTLTDASNFSSKSEALFVSCFICNSCYFEATAFHNWNQTFKLILSLLTAS